MQDIRCVTLVKRLFGYRWDGIVTPSLRTTGLELTYMFAWFCFTYILVVSHVCDNFKPIFLLYSDVFIHALLTVTWAWECLKGRHYINSLLDIQHLPLTGLGYGDWGSKDKWMVMTEQSKCWGNNIRNSASGEPSCRQKIS